MALERHLYFYHGTTDHAAEKIRTEGFSRGFLTQCPEQAHYYAAEAVEAALENGIQSNPVVLVVQVPILGLKVDFPSIEAPLISVLKKHDIRDEGDFFVALDQDKFGWPNGPDDWQRGLFLTDSVLFDGQQELFGKVVSEQDTIIGFEDFETVYPELEALEV